MKSLYQRVGLVLVITFIVQVICVSLFYNQVLVKQVLSEVSLQENNRKAVLSEAANYVSQYNSNPNVLKVKLGELTDKYDVSFTVKDSSENTICFSHGPNYGINDLQEPAIVNNGDKSFVVYGYFSAKINKLNQDEGQRNLRIFIILIVLIFSIGSSIAIYYMVAPPLKKVKMAVNNMNYGSTIVSIPYKQNDELGLLCRSLEDMGRRLNASESNQKELIQALNHDLKTPLTSILGYSKRLMEGKGDEEKHKEYSKIIYRKSQELKNLLKELDDYSLINSDNKYDKKIISVKQYISIIVDELRNEAEQAGFSFITKGDVREGISIEIDTQKINRVFMNILQNSIKYAKEKGTLELNYYEKQGKLYFEMKDNGSGVADDELNKIFERFYRVDTSRSREKGGTGLGLSICKKIIDNHDGEIGSKNIKKEDGSISGFIIWFNFPLFWETY